MTIGPFGGLLFCPIPGPGCVNTPTNYEVKKSTPWVTKDYKFARYSIITKESQGVTKRS